MKILLVEDEENAARTLQKGLSELQFQVDHAFDGQEALNKTEYNRYDVIISDVVMPFINGIEFIRKIRENGIKTPVLLLSAIDDIDYKISGLNTGADDYLVKPIHFNELIARIHALVRRSESVSDGSTKLTFHDLEINLTSKEVIRSEKKIMLTTKEFTLLVYMVKNHNRVISKTELTEFVWDIDFETNTNVVEVYINYLRNKIDKPFNKKLIHTVFGSGYIIKSE